MRLEQKVDHWGYKLPADNAGERPPERLAPLPQPRKPPSPPELVRRALRGDPHRRPGRGGHPGPFRPSYPAASPPYRGDRPATRSLVLARGPPVLVGREEPPPGTSDNPFDLRGRRHPGRIANSKDHDIAYLEARRRPARVEERIKEAKECGLTLTSPTLASRLTGGGSWRWRWPRCCWPGPGGGGARASSWRRPQSDRVPAAARGGKAGAQRQTDHAGA